MARVYIAIGSNKGNRMKNIIKGIKKIQEKVTILKVSPFIKTPPEENVNGGYFINGVVEGETSLNPEELLCFLMSIEKSIGREFPHEKGDAREIDLDIIFYDDMVIKSKNITIPHKKYRERYFVILPLYEISPTMRDPATHEEIFDIYRRLIKNGYYKKNRRGA